MNIKRAIVTGATGMIGVNLINYLLDINVEVLAIVRNNSKKISLLPKNGKIKIIECDLSNLSSLQIDKNYEYDCFFHLGWEGTIGDSRNDMYLQNRNVKNTIDAVNLAYNYGCVTFIGAGSQAEYGNKTTKLSQEMVTNPVTGYGIAKLCAGQMAKILCEKYNIKYNWCRILSIYGPFDGNSTLIFSLVDKLHKNTLFNTTEGKQEWDYLYVKDAVKALYMIAINGIGGKIYNIGSGKTRLLKEYIEIVKNLINPSFNIGYGNIPYSENQLMYLCANIDELTQDTGFVPSVEFEKGIEETVKWYLENRNEKN